MFCLKATPRDGSHPQDAYLIHLTTSVSYCHAHVGAGLAAAAQVNPEEAPSALRQDGPITSAAGNNPVDGSSNRSSSCEGGAVGWGRLRQAVAGGRVKGSDDGVGRGKQQQERFWRRRRRRQQLHNVAVEVEVDCECEDAIGALSSAAHGVAVRAAAAAGRGNDRNMKAGELLSTTSIGMEGASVAEWRMAVEGSLMGKDVGGEHRGMSRLPIFI